MGLPRRCMHLITLLREWLKRRFFIHQRNTYLPTHHLYAFSHSIWPLVGLYEPREQAVENDAAFRLHRKRRKWIIVIQEKLFSCLVHDESMLYIKSPVQAQETKRLSLALVGSERETENIFRGTNGRKVRTLLTIRDADSGALNSLDHLTAIHFRCGSEQHIHSERPISSVIQQLCWCVRRLRTLWRPALPSNKN